MSRPLTIRGRITGRPESSSARLHDPLTSELVSASPLARERFETIWSDTDALKKLVAAKRRPLAPALIPALENLHERLGASGASRAALAKLARGEAVCAISGQQPAPLGGPLYSLHKIATSVALAEAVQSRTGTPCVPVFWMHGEDSDFDEVRSAMIADAALVVRTLEIPLSERREGGLVGNLPGSVVAPIDAAAVETWAGLGGVEEARNLLTQSAAAGRDFGEIFAAFVLRLFGDRGMVVVDPRLPEFRATARPVIDRYLAAPERLAEAVRGAGEKLEARFGRRALTDSALDSFVFEIEDGARRKIAPDAARSTTNPLSPSVALRPVVQDGVLPTVAMACGPGEIAYLAQLREVFEHLEVRPAIPVPRFTATWLPPAATALMTAAEVEPWEVVVNADPVLRNWSGDQIPPDLGLELERVRREANEGLGKISRLSEQLDSSLPQLVESARGKVDYQYARLLEGMIAKARHRAERRHPEWARLRYYLLPGDKLQERRLASLEVVAHRGKAAAGEICDLAREHVDRLAQGIHEHFLLELA